MGLLGRLLSSFCSGGAPVLCAGLFMVPFCETAQAYTYIDPCIYTSTIRVGELDISIKDLHNPSVSLPNGRSGWYSASQLCSGDVLPAFNMGLWVNEVYSFFPNGVIEKGSMSAYDLQFDRSDIVLQSSEDCGPSPYVDRQGNFIDKTDERIPFIKARQDGDDFAEYHDSYGSVLYALKTNTKIGLVTAIREGSDPEGKNTYSMGFTTKQKASFHFGFFREAFSRVGVKSLMQMTVEQILLRAPSATRYECYRRK